MASNVQYIVDFDALLAASKRQLGDAIKLHCATIEKRQTYGDRHSVEGRIRIASCWRYEPTGNARYD